jgi:hypothetical protein
VHRTWRNGLGGLAAALLLAAAGLSGTTTAAAAAQPVTPPPVTIAATGFYMIVNNRTNKCVDAPASSHTSGTLLVQFGCHGGDNQRWAPFDAGDGFFVLLSKNTPSLCINIRLDFLIDQEPCNINSVDQKWQWGVANNNGDLVLFSARPGNLCFGLNPNTDKDGTLFFPIPCSNTNSANLWHPES